MLYILTCLLSISLFMAEGIFSFMKVVELANYLQTIAAKNADAELEFQLVDFDGLTLRTGNKCFVDTIESSNLTLRLAEKFRVEQIRELDSSKQNWYPGKEGYPNHEQRNEIGLMDDLIRTMVLKKLTAAGWISGVSMMANDNNRSVSYSIKWTDEGKMKRKVLFTLLGELGYESGYRVGELEMLHEFCMPHFGEMEN